MLLFRFVEVVISLTVGLSLVYTTSDAAEFLGTPRCGDCWCITDDDDGNTCPTNTTGMSDSFSSSDEIYSTFVLKFDPLVLESSSGDTNCYPFANSVDDNGDEPIYAEASGPACVPSGGDDDNDEIVCGYVYDPSSTTCEGRKYQLETFSSVEEVPTNTAIIHQGACGVCSSAQDFGARITTYGELEMESIKCATSFTFTNDFTKLKTCYSDLGFTTNCALLWAHFAATNGKTCASKCIPQADGVVLNGPAPECAASECLECQQQFRTDFDKLSGMQFQKAGITERIARDCNGFYRNTEQNPCIGITDSDDSGGGGEVEKDDPEKLDKVPPGLNETMVTDEGGPLIDDEFNQSGGNCYNYRGLLLFLVVPPTLLMISFLGTI